MGKDVGSLAHMGRCVFEFGYVIVGSAHEHFADPHGVRRTQWKGVERYGIQINDS